jgi:hypothetical protein
MATVEYALIRHLRWDIGWECFQIVVGPVLLVGQKLSTI